MAGILQSFVEQGADVGSYPRVKGSHWRGLRKEVTNSDPPLAKLPQSDSRQALQAGGFIRATPLGCLSPPWSPPPAPRPSCLRGGKCARGAGERKTLSKNIKKKTSPLAASAREVERASSGFPARPPPAAARVSPQPLLGRRPPGRGRPSIRRSGRLPSPARPSRGAAPGLRGGKRPRFVRARATRGAPALSGGGACTTRSRAVRSSRGPAPTARAPRSGPLPRTPLVEFFHRRL